MRTLLLGVLLSGLFGCTSTSVERVVQSDSYISGLESFDLKPQEKKDLELRGGKGDKKAAKRLVLYHSMITKNGAEIRKWERVAHGR